MIPQNGIVLFLVSYPLFSGFGIYPIEGTAIFHSDQLHAAICSPKFNLSYSISMASCYNFRTYGPAHIKNNSDNSFQ